MLPQNPNELSPEQIASLESARKLIPTLKAEIRRAKSAGIDVADQEKQLTELEAQLDKLYRVYVKRININSQSI